MSTLVIVESPAKCKKIEEILNSLEGDTKYIVKASKGHIRDLPNKKLGVDVITDNGKCTFKPQYEIMSGKGSVVTELKKISKTCKDVILATDLDREGEGISAHLRTVLKLENPKRIVFSEITKTAIMKAIANPRQIDTKMVNAYITRRILDRLIGYKLSPILWKNVKNGASAGRTQSVVLKMICDKEEDINKFESEGYYATTADFNTSSSILIKSSLNTKLENKKKTISFLDKCKTAIFTLTDITSKNVENKPPLPFITSTLQQEASKIGFNIAQTQKVSQELYEKGYITYIRSDCPIISEEFLPNIEKYILKKFGKEYVNIKKQDMSTNNKKKKSSKKKKIVDSQDAHECIRPTKIEQDVKKIEGDQHKKLYLLIFKRTIASQMSNRILEKIIANILISTVKSKYFIAEEILTIFKGYTAIYNLDKEDDENHKKNSDLKKLKKGEELIRKIIISTEKFTQPPAKYTESSLVKDLEKNGIGRPSTYVSSYQTNINRNYIIKQSKPGKKRKYTIITLKIDDINEELKEQTVSAEKNKLYSTDLGRLINKFLGQYFSDTINFDFTANMEKNLDNIAHGKIKSDEVLNLFYSCFNPKIEEMSEKGKSEGKLKELGKHNDKPIYKMVGKHGPMLVYGELDKNSKVKPIFVSISAEEMDSFSLEDAIKRVEDKVSYPKKLGKKDNKDIVLCKGPYGFYLKYDGRNYKIEENCAIEKDRAIQLISEGGKKQSNILHQFNNDGKEIKVMNGMYGPYIHFNKKNIKIPKDVEAKTITVDECLTIINSSSNIKKVIDKRVKSRNKRVKKENK